MQNSKHRIRIAVSYLLGILVSVLPVAAPVQAVTESFSIGKTSQTELASNTIYCSYDPIMKSRMLYLSLVSLPATNLTPYLPATIAKAKDAPVTTNKGEAPIITPQITPQVPQESPVTPTPTQIPQATPTPEAPPVVQAAAGSQLNAEVLFNLVNAHRTSIGLAPFQQDPRVCAVAASRAPELDYEIYGGGGMHAGFYARDLGYWATENMISMPTEAAALQWWLNSPVHRSAIEGNYQFACVGCAGKSCAMIFTNFAPK